MDTPRPGSAEVEEIAEARKEKMEQRESRIRERRQRAADLMNECHQWFGDDADMAASRTRAAREAGFEGDWYIERGEFSHIKPVASILPNSRAFYQSRELIPFHRAPGRTDLSATGIMQQSQPTREASFSRYMSAPRSTRDLDLQSQVFAAPKDPEDAAPRHSAISQMLENGGRRPQVLLETRALSVCADNAGGFCDGIFQQKLHVRPLGTASADEIVTPGCHRSGYLPSLVEGRILSRRPSFTDLKSAFTETKNLGKMAIKQRNDTPNSAQDTELPSFIEGSQFTAHPDLPRTPALFTGLTASQLSASAHPGPSAGEGTSLAQDRAPIGFDCGSLSSFLSNSSLDSVSLEMNIGNSPESPRSPKWGGNRPPTPYNIGNLDVSPIADKRPFHVISDDIVSPTKTIARTKITPSEEKAYDNMSPASEVEVVDVERQLHKKSQFKRMCKRVGRAIRNGLGCLLCGISVQVME